MSSYYYSNSSYSIDYSYSSSYNINTDPNFGKYLGPCLLNNQCSGGNVCCTGPYGKNVTMINSYYGDTY